MSFVQDPTGRFVAFVGVVESCASVEIVAVARSHVHSPAAKSTGKGVRPFMMHSSVVARRSSKVAVLFVDASARHASYF